MAGLPDWCKNPAQSVNYASCHDNMTLIDRITISTPSATRQEQVRMNNLAAAIYMSCQGIPFIHAGEELLRSKDFDHNSYKSPDSVNSIKWADLEKEEVQTTLAYYKGLIRLRKASPALRHGSVTPLDGLPEYTAAYTVSCSEQTMLLVFNASRESRSVALPGGSWQTLAKGQTAGTEPLETLCGQVTAEPLSAVILRKHS